MRAGMPPSLACREALEHLTSVRGSALRDKQVGFLAMRPSGEVGAMALLPGFTYAATDRSGRTQILQAVYLAGAGVV
jgi:N4-(beta-N-acetylglucosaminyl)-L-asparaginase